MKCFQRNFFVLVLLFIGLNLSWTQKFEPRLSPLPEPVIPESNLPDLHHNPWELIIYRPENSSQINEIRCWLKLEDEAGNDVTYTAATATYEWMSRPNVVNQFQKTWWLSGGMAIHLNLKKGKYKISVYTPVDKMWPYKADKPWTSNVFEYDTENPAKVIFVMPVKNDNGFYTGEWHIDYKAPLFFKFTSPVYSCNPEQAESIQLQPR